MITRNDFAESARYLDALSEEHDLELVTQNESVDPEGLHYVAEQRALRVAMLLDGISPTDMSRTEKTPVKLSEQTKALMPSLTALAMDAIMIGVFTARRKS